MAGVLIAALWAFLDPSANCRFRVAVLALSPSRPFENLRRQTSLNSRVAQASLAARSCELLECPTPRGRQHHEAVADGTDGGSPRGGGVAGGWELEHRRSVGVFLCRSLRLFIIGFVVWVQAGWE